MEDKVHGGEIGSFTNLVRSNKSLNLVNESEI